MYRTGHDLDDREIAARYSRIVRHVSMPRYFYCYVADRVARLPGIASALDVGCGNGYLLEQIAARRPDVALTGLEPSPGLVASARDRSRGRWTVAQGSATDLPFPRALFDLVTMTEVFEHLKQPAAALVGLRAMLRPGGRLLITTPNMSAYRPFWRLAERVPVPGIARAFLPWEHPRKTFQPIDTAYEYDEVLDVFRIAGMRVTSVTAREFFPYATSTIPIVRRLYAKHGQARADKLLGRVLPVRMGYRLIIECAA